MTHPKDVEALKRATTEAFSQIEGSKYDFEFGAIEWAIDYLHQRGLLAVDGVVVPREPTEEIYDAAVANMLQESCGQLPLEDRMKLVAVCKDVLRAKVDCVWRAMIAAAQGGEK